MKGILLVLEVIFGLYLFLLIVTGSATSTDYTMFVGDIILLVLYIIKERTS